MMVNLPLIALAISLVSLTGAIPVQPNSGDEPFSISNWVEDIIANPGGNNLTPEEAFAKWRTSVGEAVSDVSSTSISANGNLLQKRYTCNTIPDTEANVSDAVWCINYLAQLGSQECRVNALSVFCTHGQAQITGVAGGGTTTTSSSCNDVARGAGLVMDHCIRADNTVQGAEFANGNGNLLVWIRRPV